MAGTQRLLAIAMSFSLAGASGSGKPEALGTVVDADHARLGTEAASTGTTIYEGDRLSTAAGGVVRLQMGGAMLYLKDDSTAIVRGEERKAPEKKSEEGVEAELTAGSAVLSVSGWCSAEIVADGARICPTAEARGVVEVRVVGPNELLVYAQRGPALVTYRGENGMVEEGKTCRVLLNPSEDGADDQAPKKAGKRRRALMLLAIGAGVGIAVGVALMGRGRNVESPDRP